MTRATKPAAAALRPLSTGAIAAALLSTLVSLVSCGNPEQAAADKPAAAPAPPPAPVSVAVVLSREVHQADEFSGRIEAAEQVAVRPRVGGHLEQVHFKEGAEARKGDLLFTIDPRPYQAELQRAEAELATTVSQADLARQRARRADNLVGEKFMSKEGFDERQTELRAAEARIRAAQAAVDAARLNLDFTRVRAPISGRLGRAEVTPGNLVQSGAPDPTLLTSIVALDPIYAYFDVDEQVYLSYADLAGATKSGGAAPAIRLGLANEEGFPHSGRVNFVDNRLDAKSGTIRLRAVFDNKTRKFAPGLFARLRLESAATRPAVLITERAVGTDQNQKFALVLGAGNAVEYRPIKLGPMVDGLRIVREGLKAGEKVVVNGVHRAMPGMPVAPTMVPMESVGAPPAAPSSAPPG
jgi:RND family efflux transporter MFP subunit